MGSEKLVNKQVIYSWVFALEPQSLVYELWYFLTMHER